MMISPFFFETYGRTMYFKLYNSDAPVEFKGFLQPLRYKNKMYLRGARTDMGLNRETNYLYIGPPEYDFGTNDIATPLIIDDIAYFIDRQELVYLGDKPIYRWAIVRQSTKRLT